MRTKTLLLTAAFGAVGLTSSMAQQVFSVNAVGFVNVSVPPGFSMIANPLNAPNNTISNLFSAAVDGTTIYKFNEPGKPGFSVNTLDTGEWGDPNQTLVPGEGAFIRNPSATAFPITFVGEVMQGPLSNVLPAGFSVKSSQVPQSAAIDTVLGFPAADGDTIYQFSNASKGYTIHTFDTGEWSSGVPTPAVAESFFVKKITAGNWTRNFSVNQ
jgi:hypothetical protein